MPLLLRISRPSAVFLLSFLSIAALAQDNSPYSRYGLGDAVPTTNIVNRGMGGVSAAYQDFLSNNFSNPASYSAFQTLVDARSKKGMAGRVLLDVGINVESRTLRNPGTAQKFNTAQGGFSYLYVGVPLRPNWGLSFGIRPLTRIGYEVVQRSRIAGVDSAYSEFSGDGGSYLPSIGTGYRLKNLSVGVNLGYLFGRKEIFRKRALINDSVVYASSSQDSRSSYGGVYLDYGAQYKITINKETSLRLGATGNLRHNLRGTQDYIAETFVRTIDGSDFTRDSVFTESDKRGNVQYPAAYTLGFVLERNREKAGSYSIGADLVQQRWDDYRFFGQRDDVQNNWQLRTGLQLRPKPGRNYFSNVTYRAGFFTGPDYIVAGGKHNITGGSLGFGLPIANFNRMAEKQYTVINLALEYTGRGNDNNPLRENLFRLSLGLNLSDVWFVKRRYD